MITPKIQLIPTPSQRSSGEPNNGIKFIVCHDTGNDGSTAQGNADYFVRTANGSDQASAHMFVDDKDIIVTVALTNKAWHARYGVDIDLKMFGCYANDCALGIELCYSTKGLFDSKVAYENYCEVIAALCKSYGLDPLTKLVGHGTLDPTRRTDPLNAFGTIGVTWGEFTAHVNDLMNQIGKPTPPAPQPVTPTAPTVPTGNFIQRLLSLFKS